MEVEIFNFLSINYKKIIFLKGLNLLKGNNGSGKTTILEAIKWCLYGSKKGTKKETKVIISLDNYKIIRCKNPERIKFIKNNIEYDSIEAKEQIKNIFGTKLGWKSSSYLSQFELSTFFTGSQIDKFNLIKELISFDEEDEKIYPKLKEKENTINEELNNINYYIIKIKEKIKKFNLENDLKDFDLNFIKSSFFLKKEEIFEKRKIIYEEIIKYKNNLETQKIIKDIIKKLEEDKIKFKNFPKEYNYNNHKNYIEYIVLLQEKNKLNELKEPIETLETLINTKSILNNNKLIIEKLNLKEDEIEIKKNEWKTYIENKSIYDEWKKYNDSIEKYNYFKNKLDEKNKKLNTINKAKIFICENLCIEEYNYNVIKNYGKLICPECKSNLKIVDNKLKKQGGKLEINLINNINNYNEKIYKYENEKNEIIKQINKFKEIIPNKPIKKIDYFIENNYSIEDILKKYSIINNYKKNNINNIDDKIRTIKLVEKKKVIINKIDKIYSELFLDFEKNNINEDSYDNFCKLKESIKSKQKIIDNYKEITNFNLDKKQKKLENLDKSIININKNIKLYDEYKILKKYEEELEKEKNKYNNISKDLNNIKKILKVVRQSENESFQNFFNFFNLNTNKILNNIFDNIEINMKTIKDNKYQIDFELNKDNIKYENLHDLSGGEKFKISIAFLLVLGMIKNNKFYMFDESITNIDSESKEILLKIIKNYTINNIVIITHHEAIEGFYDNIINI